MVMTIHSTSSTAMDILTPSSLLPAVRATGRCPPLLIRDENIIEGGVFEMALLRALDRSRSQQQGKCVTCEGGGRFGSLRCKVGRCGEIFFISILIFLINILLSLGLILSVEPGAVENFTSAMKVSGDPHSQLI